MKNFIKNIFEKYEINLSETQIQQFYTYLLMLKEANSKFNITAITNDEDIVIKHFLDSIMLSKYFDITKISTLIDVGTGGGFPGIPLKILNPHLKVTLVDSLNKRIKFLDNVIDELNLTSMQAIHTRSEELAKNKDFREKYDLATSRAVAYLNILSEYCIPFVKENGYFIPLKKGDVNDELEKSKKSIEILGGKIEKIEKYEIKEIEDTRSLVFIKKIMQTEKKYPRANKQIQKKPL